MFANGRNRQRRHDQKNARRATRRLGMPEQLEARQLMAGWDGSTEVPTYEQSESSDTVLESRAEAVSGVASGAANQGTGLESGQEQQTGNCQSPLPSGCQQRAADINVLVLRPIYDTNGIARGLGPAYAVAVPSGWKWGGGIYYNPSPSLAMQAVIATHSPDGTIGTEFVASELVFAWIENSPMPIPEGQLYFGQQLARPQDAVTFFQTRILPALRQRHPDYTVVGIRNERGLALAALRERMVYHSIFGSGVHTSFDAMSVYATYTVNGTRVEESLHATLEYQRMQVGFQQAVNWGLQKLERVYAPSGTLQQQLPLLQTVARSAQPTFGWYAPIQQFRMRIKGVARTGQEAWNAYIAFQNELSQRRLAIFDQFSHYIRGTEVKRNPFTGVPIELPSKGHVWVSRDGYYVLSQDVLFDPNLDQRLGGEWRRF